jgi:hypothetical protein
MDGWIYIIDPTTMVACWWTAYCWMYIFDLVRLAA